MRGVWTLGGLAVAALLVLGLSRMRQSAVSKSTIADLKKFADDKAEGKRLDAPIHKALAFRAIALVELKESKRDAARLAFTTAISHLQTPTTKQPILDDIILGDVAISLIELAGTEDQILEKSRYDWREEPLTMMLGAVNKVKSNETQGRVVRDLVTRLLARKKEEWAATVASNLRTGGDAQALAIYVATGNDKKMDEYPKLPAKLDSEAIPLVTRLGHSEGLARRGDAPRALEIATAPGSVADRLAACLGVGNIFANDPAALEHLTNAVRGALKAHAESASTATPGQLTELCRLAGRCGLEVELSELEKGLPAESRDVLALDTIRRARLTANAALGEEAYKACLARASEANSMAASLAWHDIARHNARHASVDAVRDALRPLLEFHAPDHLDRNDALAFIGAILGDLEKHQP
jgi:hypothetical protein